MARTIDRITILIDEDPDSDNVEIVAIADISSAEFTPPMTFRFRSGAMSTLKVNRPYTQEKEIAFRQIIRRLQVLGFMDEEIDAVLEKQMDNEKDAATVS